MSDSRWINAKDRKPEGDIFWALTEGRYEQGGRDWVIVKIRNSECDDYRSLDYSATYGLPGSSKAEHLCMKIYAWMPLEDMPIDDRDYD